MTGHEEAMQLDPSQHLYSNASGVRATFQSGCRDAATFYSDYLSFVKTVAPPTDGETSCLDVGCGCGWSSYFFAESGYEATGVDLNPDAFEPPSTQHLDLRYGSMLELPFANASFDIVATYQCLEHVPNPRRGLEEMQRVLKPGGTIIVVGPNLVSPYLAVKGLLSDIFGKGVLRRSSSTPFHPYGNTVFEHILCLVSSSILLIKKLFSRRADFCMRSPDLVPPFHADNDACYLCTPVDLVHYFGACGYSKVQNGKPGRVAGSWLFAGGTWVAYRKPESELPVADDIAL